MVGKGKLYVVVNTELRMSRGKIAAQIAHAVARLKLPAPPYVVIVLAGRELQMKNLDIYLSQIKGIQHHLYIDEGANEVPPMTATALAFGLFDAELVPDFIKGFDLLREEKKRWLR